MLNDAKIIFQVHHSTWVANLVLFRYKSCEIFLCVHFFNLNRAYEKDNHLVPPMDHILQLVLGSIMFSLLDGFSSYNRVLVAKNDRLKTTFKTKWSTFFYNIMLVGLIIIGATFQKSMDIDFRGLKNQM